ncbi:homeodomain-like protein [Tanacetum coccineum]
MPYPARKIRRIRACTHQIPQRKEDQYAYVHARSSKELFTPYKDPEREFRSSRRHFKTLSLDKLRSPDFNLFSDQENSKEEEAETMAKIMEQYMSKTQDDYVSGVVRPKIKDKDNFELKGQFLKELRTNTFSGSDHEDANEHNEKVLEIVDLFHILNITIDQVMLRAFPMSLTGAEKDPGSFTLPCFINNVCFDNALVDLGASVSVMPLSTYLNLRLGELAHTKLIVELADMTPKGIAENVLVSIGKFVFPVNFIILDMLEDIKVPLILGRSFLSTARAKIDVYKRKITLRVKEERIIFISVKPASGLIRRVYMLSLRERMVLDLEARLMGETLVLNRSLDPFFEDYIELNDLNEPYELRRNQGDNLMPTIKEGEVIAEYRTMDDELDTGIDDYPSYCDDDKKIHVDCAHNLKFSCMIGFKFTHANFFQLLYVNVMSKKFHNSIMKDKMVYKGNNVIGALMNVPIFVLTFSIVTDFAVLENMDAYRDDGMGDVIFGEPFLREVGIKTKWFEGMITIYNGNDEVTYQMMRSHSRFKHHTNEQCNKIPPLLKVSKEDKMNGISHPYQKLKGFYKGVLNLGPDYIHDAKMEEWLTRGHISVYEIEW